MILMNGISGLASPGDGCPPATHYWDSQQQACLPFDMPQQTVQSQADVPWWQPLIAGVTQGAVSSIVGSGTKPAAPPLPAFTAPPATPWYTTPTGMIGIGVGALALIMLLRK
jgi:hypothetical protein